MPGSSVELGSGEPDQSRRRAAEPGPPVESVVHEPAPATPSQPLFDEAAWRQRFVSFLAGLRRDLPTDVPPERIEADITAARDEVRQARRAARCD